MTATISYLNTWKRFISEGVLDSSRLNKRIMESRYRCKKEKVNPYLNKGHHVLTNDLLNIHKEKNSLLMEAATPHIAKMDQAIKESGMMALLVDPEGYVLSLTGNKKLLNDAHKINFVEGVRWTEEEVGTNAIGTALHTGEAVMINGTEHYSIASHNWSCSATPIYNDDGKLMGVINVSSSVDHSHPFMLGMVASIAHAIEQELSMTFYKKEIALTQQSIELADTYQYRPFIVCNQKQTVISASKPVRERIPQAIGMKLHDLLQIGFQIEMETPLLSKEGHSEMGKCLFLSKANDYTQNRLSATQSSQKPLCFNGVMGTSEAFGHTLKKVNLVSPTDASVYILGETGSGKELIARAIHENSPRKNGPFIALNCGTIPKDLMESELFGYAEGAFTGAKRQGYKGKFEQANHGTIFLDEIGEIPPSMQVALLRVLQERKVVPIGGTKEIPLDIRIISATYRNLTQLVNEGTFRKDLYYRLYVYPIFVPSLRDRKEDIPQLVQYFCQKNDWKIQFPDEFFERLNEYHWPGNIRELLNVLERLHILLSDDLIDKEQILNSLYSLDINQQSTSQSTLEHQEAENEVSKPRLTVREKIQRDLMMEALQRTKGNVTSAAKLLDIPRSTFYKRLQKFGL